MPYTIEQIGSDYCVFLESDTERTRDTSLGCHETIGDAEAQIAAIEASEADESDTLNPKDDIVTYQKKAMPVFIDQATVKQDTEQGIVSAYTAIMGNIDYGHDIIQNGAFKKTITERGSAGKIRVLDNHRTGSVTDAVARILSIREVGRETLPDAVLTAFPDATGGLYVQMQFMLDDERSAAIFKRIRRGLVDEYSIGFEILQSDIETRQTDEGTVDVRIIKEIKLYEVSPVLFAMNAATITVGTKNDTPSPDEKQAPNYREANGTPMCKSCNAYGAVTAEKGWCKMYDMPCGAGMVCDSYEARAEPMTAGDYLREEIKKCLVREADTLYAAGVWGDDDRAAIGEIIDKLAESVAEALPDEMRDRTLPPDVMTMPKSLTSQDDDEAEPDDAPLTSTSPGDTHDEKERLALIRNIQRLQLEVDRRIHEHE